MTARTPPTIDDEADRFETALKVSRIPGKMHDGLWSVWVDDPARAHHLIARFKEYPAVRQKAAPPMDDFDRLGQQIAEAARTQAMQAGSDRASILKHLGVVLAQLSGAQPAARALTDQGASSLKTSDPFAAAFQGDLRSDMTPR